MVQPHQLVRTAWVNIDSCRLGFRMPMSPEAVEKKFRRLLNLGDCAPWPPVVGHWEGERFLVDDGRHDYLAALMLGRDKLFVCWLETALATEPSQNATTNGQLQLTDRDASAASAVNMAGVGLSDHRLPAALRGLWHLPWRRVGKSADRTVRAEAMPVADDQLRPPGADRLPA